MRTLSVLLVALGSLVLSSESVGQRRPVVPAVPYRWEAAAAKAGLAPEEIDLLKKQKVLLADQPFKQVFEPYNHSELPVFITADSLLNAYHVLFEESLSRWEAANAQRLPQLLLGLRQRLKAAGAEATVPPEQLAAAKRRAGLIVGVALELLGQPASADDEAAAKLIRDEAKLISKASGVRKPGWLGPSDAGFVAFDYSRFQPRGFYTKTDRLRRYFRAMSWLQAIPFRIDQDEELAAILLMGSAMKEPADEKEVEQQFRARMDRWWERDSLLRGYRTFIGAGDDWDLHVAERRSHLLKEGLAGARKRLHEDATDDCKRPHLNDQLAFVPPDGSTAEVAFRILAPARAPDAVLFQRLVDPRRIPGLDRFPQGLHLCAALGSRFARAQLGPEAAKELAIIDETKPLFMPPRDRDESCLYLDYLYCVQALFAEPEPEAPAFLKSEVWQRKTCQTVLGGWAQLRHAWVLQAKQSASYGGLAHLPAGYIEPVPEFYARLARHARRAEEQLDRSGAFAAKVEEPVDLPASIKLIEGWLATAREDDRFFGRTPEEQKLIDDLERPLRLLNIPGPHRSKAYWAAALPKLKELRTEIRFGGSEMDLALNPEAPDVSRHWRDLHVLCLRLEALSQKQLRGAEFSDVEKQELLDYGGTLGNVMLYGGNAWLAPRDDAPRIVDVHFNPNVPKSYLHVGISRPRALYVLWPTKTGEVLCRGAMLPYHEFPHGQRLTDEKWRGMQNGNDLPQVPTWARPLVTPDGFKALPARRE